MTFLERVNRILVGMLLLLVFAQVGLLVFLKSMHDQAEYRLVKNTSKADIQCGRDQFSSENYWNILNENVLSHSDCSYGSCDKSQVQWQREKQDKELHVVSIVAPPPINWETMEGGGVVKLQVKGSERPQILALISRSPLQWSFQLEKGARVEKVIVATPNTVWLDGLPQDTPIEYLPKEKMCSYPYAWDEAFNPENEFRVLLGSLRQVTGLQANSFQGAEVGRRFQLPPRRTEIRQLASVNSEAPSVVAPETSVRWKLAEGFVRADRFHHSSGKSIELPEKARQALEVDGSIYVVVDGEVQVWEPSFPHFETLLAPLELPGLGEALAMTYDPAQKKLWIYNDQRGGEFFSYQVKKKSWELEKTGFPYVLAALEFDSEKQELVALISRGTFLRGLVHVPVAEGVALRLQEFDVQRPLDKSRWRYQLQKDASDWKVAIFTPANPEGQLWTLP